MVGENTPDVALARTIESFTKYALSLGAPNETCDVYSEAMLVIHASLPDVLGEFQGSCRLS